ncbi:DUF6152 family protein [Phreatobacter sp.]|uniref:DUF6152 family protein n=1 Tax=Phreatobacter sp. TaxID=1966341 RepID=UPI003F703AA8
MTTRRQILIAGIATFGVAVLPAGVAAHHGWGGFDRSKVLDFTGVVARSTYANPHGTLFMVRDGQELTIELSPTSRMQARGLSPEDIAAGKTVRVYAYQNRGNPQVFRAEWVEVEGRRVQLR